MAPVAPSYPFASPAPGWGSLGRGSRGGGRPTTSQGRVVRGEAVASGGHGEEVRQRPRVGSGGKPTGAACRAGTRWPAASLARGALCGAWEDVAGGGRAEEVADGGRGEEAPADGALGEGGGGAGRRDWRRRLEEEEKAQATAGEWRRRGGPPLEGGGQV